jgi:ADP-heptose:LPS heptosyltransferase
MNRTYIKGNIKNILVIRRNNIGDMICALPLLKTLRKEFPQAHITVLADSANSIIIKNEPYIDNIIVNRKGNGIFKNKYLNLWMLFRQNKVKFDLSIVIKAGFSSTSALMSVISGARIRMGCIPDKWHPLQLCYNLPLKVKENWHTLHIKDIFIEMIKPLGITDPVRDISFEIPQESKEKVRNFFDVNNLQAADNIVVFNISNNRTGSIWPVERYKELSELISKEYNSAFIITSVPADKETAIMLSIEINNAVYFVDRITDFAADLRGRRFRAHRCEC